MDSRELPIAMWQGSDREELAMVALTRTWVLRHTIDSGYWTPAHVVSSALIRIPPTHRVAGLGRLSAEAKMAMKPFVKRVFTIFATNASFLRIISNF